MNLENLYFSELYVIPILFIAGSCFHFAYKWSKFNKRVAVFGAVNESLWEHMKIAFWPMFFWSMIQYILWMDYVPEKFLLAKTLSLVAITITIPLFVLTYTSILKKYIFFIDLPLFLVCIIISQYIGFMSLKEWSFTHWAEHLAIIPLFTLIIFYSTFTFDPPAWKRVFQDPTNKKFGEEATNKDPNKKAEFITPIE